MLISISIYLYAFQAAATSLCTQMCTLFHPILFQRITLVILEVFFTYPSKQRSGSHLFPLLKESPLKRQIVQCTWLSSLENVLLAKIYWLHVSDLQNKNFSILSHPENKMRETANQMFCPWMTQDGEFFFFFFPLVKINPHSFII